MNNNSSHKMQIRESLGMEANDGGTIVEGGRGYLITRMTLVATAAIVCCLLLGSGLLIYHFSSCEEQQYHTSHQHTTLCEHQHSTLDYNNHQQQPHQHPATTSATVATHQEEFDSGAMASGSVEDASVTTNRVSDMTNSTIMPMLEEALDGSSIDEQHNLPKENLRLPRSLQPLTYDIRLKPWLDEDNFTFYGTVDIVVSVLENCNNVTLHAVALRILDATVEWYGMENDDDVTEIPSSSEHGIARRFVDIDHNITIASKQFFVLMLKQELQKGEQYVVRIRYEGILNDYLQGFYRSSYTMNNETKWIATTQFQPTDARRAFPCFDEPALKAKFTISIARKKNNMTSLSNMPRLHSYDATEPELHGYVWDVYQQSVPMSTYLVAFVVCDYVNISNGNFSVWTRADAISSARYALSVGPKLLKFLEGFFHIDYPLPKLDMIALPDFSAGAMENWGLITYRETAMLYEENVSAISNKQHVITVVAHELAHQWFGNLVTPSWWTDLWLNEGFASYMEYLGVDAVEPAWKSMEQFVVNELHNVFSLDALSSSHQISVEVHNPEEIHEIFDKISYGKGATIIRMMDHFLTTDVFKQGLTNYLNHKKYQSATQDDLWEYLTNEARSSGVFDEHTSVKEIMDTWTLQTGFPVVFVRRDYETDSIVLQQTRFSLGNAAQNGTSDGERLLWWIPITYTTLGESNFQETKPTIWMKAEEMLVISNHDIPSHDWLIVNLQQTGYYRVNYDERNWQLIVDHLQDRTKFKTIAASNRAQLIDDALNLARAGYLDYSVALNVTRYLVHETEYVPWKAAISALSYIDSMLVRTRHYGLFKKYSMDLFENIYNQVGFEDHRDDALLTVYKRISILKTVCHLGSKDCVNHAIRKFYEWMHEPNPDINNPISPNLKSTVYCTAIKYGDEMEWNFAWERFQRATVASEKEILLSALGCSRVPWILTRFLENSMSDEYGIRKQDAFRVFLSVSDNVIGQSLAFDYMRNNWIKMKSYFGSAMSNLNIILKYSTKRFNTESELLELKEFAETHLKDSGRTIQQSVERTEANIECYLRSVYSDYCHVVQVLHADSVCLGVLVNEYYILTTAGCVPDDWKLVHVQLVSGWNISIVERLEYKDYKGLNVTKDKAPVLLRINGTTSLPYDNTAACLWPQSNLVSYAKVQEVAFDPTLNKMIQNTTVCSTAKQEVCLGKTFTEWCHRKPSSSILQIRDLDKYSMHPMLVGLFCDEQQQLVPVSSYAIWIRDVIASDRILFNIPNRGLGEKCITSNDKDGVCLRLESCPQFFAGLKRKTKNITSIEQCGFDGSDVLHCCPNEDLLKSESNRQKLDAIVQEVEHCHELYDVYRRTTKEQQLHSQLALIRNEADKVICTGTLISQKFVLTAAQCVLQIKAVKSTVKIGVTATYDQVIQVRKVASTVIHPLFEPQLSHYNIAIIELDTPILVTEYSVPACMWPESERMPTKLTSTGYDTTANAVTVNVVNPLYYMNCRLKYYRNLTLTETCVLPDTDENFCGDKPSACSESGTGMYSTVYMNYDWRPVTYVVGVYSNGAQCAQDGPAIYTRVSEYFAWIKSELYRISQDA
ncbi:aminopeptidase N-like [Anopheles albimanus]|uniref:aminopeptidase N-like n=1 Tax=Anopheles albimanus TaxID=7167 RepID=UPI0016414AF3|nr:aminopeptidase N-like [Anopheles albimanus]